MAHQMNIVKMKINLIKAQKAELHESVDAFVNKHAPDSLETQAPAVSNVTEINAILDTVLVILVQTCSAFGSEIENITQNIPLLTFKKQSALDQPTSDVAASAPWVLNMQRRIEGLETRTIHEELPHTDLEKDNQTLSKIEELSDKIQLLNCRLEDMEKKQTTSFERALENAANVKTMVQQMEDENKQSFISKNDFTDWMVKMNKSVEDLGNKYDDTQYDLGNLMEQSKEWDEGFKSIKAAMVTLETTEESIEKCVRKQLEDRKVEDVEESGLCQLEQKVEDLDSLCRQICQLVASRLDSLFKLQMILNEKKLKDEIQTKSIPEYSYPLLSFEEGACSQEDNDNDDDSNEDSYGFTAYFDAVCSVEQNEQLSCFADILHDESNDFDESTGEFTAPISGLYLASVGLRQVGDGKIRVHVKCRSGNGQVAVVCKAMSCGDGSSSCGIGVVRMDAGDTLFVKVTSIEEEPQLSPFTSFTCCLLN
ncbi:unnamed protein product [Lymnaea stagnalis]|uniref:C1q domain-containing protein n=1 Tax=Lymnaea stagnalis TaxID=6523 RepID=A0AAV2HFI3_LYMST